METSSFHITLLMVITVIAGITAQVLADYLKVPAIVFLLFFGILVGNDGLSLVQPNLLGSGLEVIVSLSVALILFEGGLSLDLRALGQVSGSIRNLVTFGTLITLMGAGMAAHWLGEFPWPIAFLYASLVVVTGPTVIGPLLKQVSVDRQVSALLEGEGVLIDPVGAILAVLVLNVVLNGNTDPLEIMGQLLLRLSIGAGIGVIGGGILGWLLKTAQFMSEELKNLVVLAALWGLFDIAELLMSESGLMTTVVTGMMVRYVGIPDMRQLLRFKGQLTMLAVSVLFILLAADLSLDSIVALGWGSVFTVLALMWVVRPINIWLCTLNSNLNWRQKLFASWVSPRGIVSASVASLFAILLTQRGINGGDSIKALVFLTIIMTVVIQGLTARWMAKTLGITSSSVTGAVIVGSNPLSRLIGKLFQERDELVVMIDTDPEACEQARQQGLTVYQSSALDPNVLEEAGLESIGTFLAMTSNGEVNVVLAERADTEFNPPRVLALFPREPQTKTTVNREKVQQAFIPDLPLKQWNTYLEDREVKLGETVLRQPGLEFQRAHLQALIRSGELIPLLIERDGNLQVLPASESWQVGDQIIYLLHDPKPKLLKRLSGSQQSNLTLEKHPVVEEVPLEASLTR
ncbi:MULTISPECIES: cation:proton antiporter [Planktothrix]|uniref:Cation:proton antiporter n=1 Tax=Planktothrix mougeotii LEGE 06226 TaxID=1828728 RepID=A0ABR9UFC7_9CYAN|nr:MULTISPECIES: sodium:proton antiporter [Planktothrix]MBD2481860.1 cation:proton antiporter [Planktothrix sp. FACHB-1365]MBE9145172.1 cation:proton antiporter [Planktothrix mougeotii LEGE 06226]